MTIGFRHVLANHGQCGPPHLSTWTSPAANDDLRLWEFPIQIVPQPFVVTVVGPDERPMHLQEPQGYNNDDPWACPIEL